MKQKIVLFGALASLLPTIAFAESFELGEFVAVFSMRTVWQGALIIFALIVLSVALTKPSESVKRILFGLIAAVVLGVTAILAGLTIYLNSVSWSHGPVHWHADFEVWACGRELDLVDPKGTLSNKTGTPVYHEHNDKRLHVEGVIVNEADASVAALFTALGATLSHETLSFPTNNGVETFQNSSPCSEEEAGVVQAFVFAAQPDGYYTQQKIDPASYVLSAHAQVPPGDCIIVEFDVPKDRTDKLCRSYQAAKEIGTLKGER